MQGLTPLVYLPFAALSKWVSASSHTLTHPSHTAEAQVRVVEDTFAVCSNFE